MKISREYGGWVSSTLIFSLALGIILVKRENFIDTIFFWAPIFFGITIFDVSIMNISKDKYAATILVIAAIIGIFSIMIYFLMLFVYLLFLLIFFSRPYFRKIKRMYINTVLGMFALVLSFFLTMHFMGINAIFFSIALFAYLIGAEFTVRSFLHRSKRLLVYNILPMFFIIFNPFYLIFSISLFRIPVAVKFNRLKYVGIAESMLLLIIVIYMILLSLLKINAMQIYPLFF